MTELSATELMVWRGGRAILQNVSMRAESGEFVAVIGANGAGKSTLLTALAGLSKPDLGMVRLDDCAVSNLTRAEIARRRAYLPQNPRCEWPLSVERLVALGLTPTLPVFGDMPRSYRTRISDVLASCDLLDRREQPATTLSGGELSRAMLARALVGDPDILIADEPMAGLDPRHAMDCIQRLRDFASRGKLVIASVHDLTMAARYATRIVALSNGRIVADGPSEKILTPALLRDLFAVEACISGENGNTYIDFIAPVASPQDGERTGEIGVAARL